MVRDYLMESEWQEHFRNFRLYQDAEIHPGSSFLSKWQKKAIEIGLGDAPLMHISKKLEFFANLKTIDYIFLSHILICLERRMTPNTSSQVTLKIFIDLSRLGIQPSKRLIQKWTDNLDMTNLDSDQLFQVIYSLQKFGCCPLEFVGKWEQVAMKKMMDFRVNHLSHMIALFLKLSIVPSDPFLYIWMAAVIHKLPLFRRDTTKKTMKNVKKLQPYFAPLSELQQTLTLHMSRLYH